MKILNMMKVSGLVFATLLWSSLALEVSAQISLGAVSYTQNFNTLANTGTSISVPSGWAFLETGSSANTTYTAGTGSSTTGDTYSFGSSGSTERAFGGLRSGALVPIIGASFKNETGATINQLSISYYGEQWRIGVTNRGAADRMDFQYSTNATSIISGTWTDVDNLDFNSPVTLGTAGSLDGNTSANRTNISFTITGLNISNGSTFWIRWTDYDIPSSDDGLAIDDFEITGSATSCTPPTISQVDVTQPTCISPTGELVISANGSGTLEYSVNNGVSYQGSATFSSLNPGIYTIKVRLQADQSCVATYTSNPVVLNTPTGCLPDCGNLFFSEYMEGSSFNKCLEIYNPTGSAIDLAAGGYKVNISFNGGTSTNSTNLTGTIYSGSVYIICHTSLDTTLGIIPNQMHNNIQFNGDDAVELVKGTTTLDVIGQIGFRPTAEWGSGLTSTADNTLRRKPSVQKGDDDGGDAFVPATEWLGFAQNTADGFGFHATACVCVTPVFSAPTVTQPTCAVLTGTIKINIATPGDFEYSVDNGATWKTTNTISGLEPGSYHIKVRWKDNPSCMATYASNPIVLTAAPLTKLSILCKDHTVFLGGTGVASIRPVDVYIGPLERCISVNLTGISRSEFTCADIGKSIPVTLNAIDMASNKASCVSTVKVLDSNMPPSISCTDLAIQINEKGVAELTPAQVLLSEVNPCNVGTKVLSKTIFNCNDVGPNSVVLTVTNLNGSTNRCNVFVTVIGHPSINSGVLEICDGIDNNCNGLVDEGFDLDGNGYTSCAGDCDDFNPAVNPGAKEICNGVDENCNGLIDEGVTPKWYADADGDGFGDPGNMLEDCFEIFGYVSNNKDCDDTNAAIFPGAPELCDGIDNNCNKQFDENAKTPWYRDTDGDGFGNPAMSVLACTAPEGYLADKTDCNDGNANIHPGAAELCNGIDDNCNGLIDEGVMATWYADADGDGYGNPAVTALGCVAPTGFVADNTDCHDGKAHINPGMPELCNGLDDNCNGLVDEGVTGGVYVGSVSFTTQAQLNAWRACYGVIDGNLYIFGNDITDLSPLLGLTKVTGHVEIKNNLVLKTLQGLNNLKEIGGSLSIYFNNVLATLNGLNNLAKVNAGLGIFYNPSLSDCCPVYNLLNSGGVRRYTSIFGNRTGCESVTGIITACGMAPLQNSSQVPVTTVPNPVFKEYNLIVYPNPAQTEVNLVLPGVNAPTEISIYDQLGRIVWTEKWEKGRSSTTISLEETRFVKGVYTVKAVTFDQVLAKQLVIHR